jgi:hypothetical protein
MTGLGSFKVSTLDPLMVCHLGATDVIMGTQGVCEYLLAQWQHLPQA